MNLPGKAVVQPAVQCYNLNQPVVEHGQPGAKEASGSSANATFFNSKFFPDLQNILM